LQNPKKLCVQLFLNCQDYVISTMNMSCRSSAPPATTKGAAVHSRPAGLQGRSSIKQQQELQHLTKLQQQQQEGMSTEGQLARGAGAAGVMTQFERLLGADGQLMEFEYPRM
jgi:hypothetical protein